MSRNNATPKQPVPNAQQAAREKMARENEVLAARRGATVTVGEDGQQFTIRPMVTKQIFAFVGIVRPIFAALAKKPDAGRPGLPQADGQGGTNPDDQAALDAALPTLAGSFDNWLGLMEDYGPEVLRALAVMIERDQALEVQQHVYNVLENVEIGDVLVVLRHAITANVDFLKAQGLTLHDLRAAQAHVLNPEQPAQ